MKKLRVLLLVAVLVFSLAVPCFAVDDGTPIIVDGVSYPVYTSNHGNIIEWANADSNRHVLIYTYGAAVRMKLCESPVKPYGAALGADKELFVSGSKMYQYTLVDGEWVYNSSADMISGGSIGSVDTNGVIVSSRSYSSGTYFKAMEAHSRFRGALPEMILEVAGEQLAVTLPDLGGTMKVLALCGIGCLALLVVLKLFGKRSLIYLRK